jgi:cytochrome c oxidase subunit 1
LSGIFMAATPVDIFIHDTYFIVGHIHYVLFGGSLFAVFAGIHYWFPKMFGRMLSETLGKIHFWGSFVAFNCTFFMMHVVGMAGMPRRYAQYNQFDTWKDLVGVNRFMTWSAFALGAFQLVLIANILISLVKGKRSGANPWNATTLEWSAPSPPPHGNFAVIPNVYRGPYEYSSPESAEDWLPQDRLMPGDAKAAAGAH